MLWVGLCNQVMQDEDIRVSPDPIRLASAEEEGNSDTEGRKPCRGGGGDWNYAAMNPGTLEAYRSGKRRGRTLP